MKILRSKRGSELVEASLVLPLLILMTASLIGAGAFSFRSMRDMCRTQRELLEEVDGSSAVYEKIEKNTETSSDIMGAYRETLRRSYTATARAIDEAAVIRAGDIAGIVGEGGSDEEQ